MVPYLFFMACLPHSDSIFFFHLLEVLFLTPRSKSVIERDKRKGEGTHFLTLLTHNQHTLLLLIFHWQELSVQMW